MARGLNRAAQKRGGIEHAASYVLMVCKIESQRIYGYTVSFLILVGYNSLAQEESWSTKRGGVLLCPESINGSC